MSELNQANNHISPARYITETELATIWLRRHTQGLVAKKIWDASDYDNLDWRKRKKTHLRYKEGDK